jgi:hypothetical protein
VGDSVGRFGWNGNLYSLVDIHDRMCGYKSRMQSLQRMLRNNTCALTASIGTDTRFEYRRSTLTCRLPLPGRSVSRGFLYVIPLQRMVIKASWKGLVNILLSLTLTDICVLMLESRLSSVLMRFVH